MIPPLPVAMFGGILEYSQSEYKSMRIKTFCGIFFCKVWLWVCLVRVKYFRAIEVKLNSYEIITTDDVDLF